MKLSPIINSKQVASDVIKGSILSREQQKKLVEFNQRYDLKNKRPIQWAVKRATDYLGASVALMIAAPLFLLISAAIKLDSKGPLLFNQKRIGKDGKLFKMYKFRGMQDSAPKDFFEIDEKTKCHITRVGKFIRKYSLDELPQLFNILQGKMSLIGPRPNLDFEKMEKIDPDSVRRFSVSPGARLGYKSLKNEDLQDYIDVEKKYLENWTLASDFDAFTRILRKMVRGQNV